MALNYQKSDRNTLDYELWYLAGGQVPLRGPRVQFAGTDYVCFLGAAQTFGRFVADPFVHQVGRFLDRPCVNLGLAGAGPEAFLDRKRFRRVIQNASLVVIQSMSGRSVSAGVFKAGGNNGVLEFLSGPRKGEKKLAQDAYQLLRDEYGEEAFNAQVQTAQEAWLARHRELIELCSGKTLYLWMSQKEMHADADHHAANLGVFPHFVTGAMVDEIRGLCDATVDATYSTMRAQPIRNMFTGQLEVVYDEKSYPNRSDRLRCFNNYYATPEMHDYAARLLCHQIIKLT